MYAGLSVADHLKLGARLNPGWDAGLARGRVDRLDLDPGQKAGTLSGGQRAQIALTLAVAKRPELLVLDEPVASLDPLARREFLADLMEAVADQELSVVLSSHLVADLERVCDYLIVLVGSRVRVAGPVDELLAIFAAAQLAMPLWVRPHLIPPDHTVATIDSARLDFGNLTATVVPGQPGAWILSSGAVNAAGQPVSNLPAACQAAMAGLKPSSPSQCLESRGFREAITYESANRYWPLQWIETGIFLARRAST